LADVIYAASSRRWIIQMETSTYSIGLSADDTSLQHIYWGPRVSPAAAREMAHDTETLHIAFESRIGISREEYVPWGEMRYIEPSLKLEYADGTRAIEWVFEEHGVERSEGGGDLTLWLRFHDRAYPLTVTLYYRVYAGHDVIERWVQLENNGGSGPIIIEQALSADWRLPRRERYRLTYLYGQYAQETQVAFEGCAGGGGRVDLGILSRVEQVWTSDNTDAFDRLRIQEGFSYAYAPRVMMCWVTDSPNYLTRRTLPLSYRFHVAMAGALGIGGDLSRWMPPELEEARDFIALYKRVRSTIQNGRLYRLRSPRTAGVASSQYVAPDNSEVVVFAWGLAQQGGETQVALALRGLEREARYADAISGATYSGAYLVEKVLPLTLLGDFDSRMVQLVRIASA
jgi:alpha-galactosidase